jgi:hypothetical protein
MTDVQINEPIVCGKFRIYACPRIEDLVHIVANEASMSLAENCVIEKS